jgi:serine/threonine protein kinase
MSRGSLHAVLHDRSQRLAWRQRLGMLRDAARAIAFLHSQQPYPVLHRDVKSPNLLVDANYTVKLGDLGFARERREGQSLTRCGTLAWTAPEILSGRDYTKSADVYSLGIVMWEILTRREPYEDCHFMELALRVREGHRPSVPSDCPPAYSDLMTRCWHASPSSRPSADSVVRAVEGMLGYDRGRNSTDDLGLPPI